MLILEPHLTRSPASKAIAQTEASAFRKDGAESIEWNQMLTVHLLSVEY